LFHSGHYSHFVVLIYFDASNGLQADLLHYSYNKKPNRRNKVNVFHNGHRFSESTGPPVLLHLLFLTLFSRHIHQAHHHDIPVPENGLT
jgi:hypothetical protein